MVRAPCCEKMGLKKGPWSKEEDQILIAYIKNYGHGNWRALPKQAGLLRCGKSCRLRWTNYLRPDIKRGNFSREEEENIIKLHELLGNRWSAIAVRLPGRTDNEIKNVWHTHLKKRLKQNPATVDSRRSSVERAECNAYVERDAEPTNFSTHQTFENPAGIPSTPQSKSDISSPATYSTNSTDDNLSMAVSDENLWSGELSVENQSMPEFYEANSYDLGLQFPFSPSHSGEQVCSSGGPYEDESMNFWFNVYMGDGQWPELPEF